MGEWKEYLLDEVIEKFIDYRGKTPTKTDSGVPLITAKVVKNGTIAEPNEFISKDDYHSWMRRGYPEVDDIVLTTEAPLGEVALLKTKDVALAQRIITLRANPKKAYNPFIKYYLQSPPGQFELESRASGTTVLGIKSSVLKKLPVMLPDLPEQRAIASVLSSLDAKIDLLHRQNKTLEAMAEALFRQWFVEEAEEGWEEGTLGDIIEIHDSKRVPLSNLQRAAMQTGQLYPYYGAATIMDHVNDFLFDGEYILLGEDGTVVTEDGYPVLQYATGKFWVNNHAHVLQAKPPYTNRYLWTFLKKQNIADIVTGAVQPKISQGNLKALPIVLPPAEVVEQICTAIAPLYAKLDKNLEQTRTLTALRDTLLPKLMSGEVRVEMK